MVQSILKPQNINSLGLIIDDVYSMLKYFNQVSVRFVNRYANETTHICAKAALSLFDL